MPLGENTLGQGVHGYIQAAQSCLETPLAVLGEENGNPLQYSCLENSVDGEAWQATVHGVTELDTTEQLTLCCS